jgi:hypothetical protein
MGVTYAMMYDKIPKQALEINTPSQSISDLNRRNDNFFSRKRFFGRSQRFIIVMMMIVRPER